MRRIDFSRTPPRPELAEVPGTLRAPTSGPPGRQRGGTLKQEGTAPRRSPLGDRGRCSLRQQLRLIDEPIARARAHYPACGEGSPNGQWNAQRRRAFYRAAASKLSRLLR